MAHKTPSATSEEAKQRDKEWETGRVAALLSRDLNRLLPDRDTVHDQRIAAEYYADGFKAGRRSVFREKAAVDPLLEACASLCNAAEDEEHEPCDLDSEVEAVAAELFKIRNPEAFKA